VVELLTLWPFREAWPTALHSSLQVTRMRFTEHVIQAASHYYRLETVHVENKAESYGE
jgi:hypothetical protein